MSMKSQQSGRFVMGLVVGLLIGLALALGVALYVNKVPVPWVNKVPQRTPDQDAAEAEKNRNWDPNASLYGRNPAHAGAASDTATTTAPTTVLNPPPPGINVVTAPQTSPSTATSAAAKRDPAAMLANRAASAPSTDPLYFLQAGAYGRTEDAEQQRAKLGMLGFTAKVTEREQSGRTVYRVRLGPFDKKDDADAAKERLDGNGVESALVRVQR